MNDFAHPTRCGAGFVPTTRCWSALPWRTPSSWNGRSPNSTRTSTGCSPRSLRPGTGWTASPGWASGPRRRSLPRSGWTPRCSPPPRTFPSWAGRCSGNNLTGGKRRSGKPSKGNRWLGEVLTRVRLGGGAQPRQLPVGPLLAARPAHRQQERRPSRCAGPAGRLLVAVAGLVGGAAEPVAYCRVRPGPCSGCR